MSHMRKARQSCSHTRRLIRMLLDLQGVPDGGSLAVEATSALQRLDGVLRQLDRQAGEESKEAGPLIYPIPGEDPRDYPTSLGGLVREKLDSHLRGKVPASILDSGLCLRLSEPLEGRRVLTLQQFIRALRSARPHVEESLAVLAN